MLRLQDGFSLYFHCFEDHFDLRTFGFGTLSILVGYSRFEMAGPPGDGRNFRIGDLKASFGGIDVD